MTEVVWSCRCGECYFVGTYLGIEGKLECKECGDSYGTENMKLPNTSEVHSKTV